MGKLDLSKLIKSALQEIKALRNKKSHRVGENICKTHLIMQLCPDYITIKKTNLPKYGQTT